MPSLVIEDFRLGLDRRKSPVTSAPGSLYTLDNGHITAGGEIEPRKAFVSDKTLPAGTIGMAATAGQVYVFGHGTAPGGMPSGVNYQQLAHPSGQALSKILNWDAFDGKLYVVAEYADGSVYHFYNGARVTAWFDGRARAQITVTGGAGGDSITALKVNGVDVLGATVNWATSNTATATAIAAQINTYTSSPDYSATTSGATVNIVAALAGTTPNGYIVSPTLTGTFSVSPSTTTMAGGASGSYTPGGAVLTFRNKVYSVSGELLHFSAPGDPTAWTSATPGAGFVNVANQDGDGVDLQAIQAYFQQLAVFSRNSVQLWNVNADPAQNTHVQTLKNTGTVAPKTAIQYGANDVFYLADNGLRSLRARDSSNSAAVSDVGSPVDTILVAAAAALGSAVSDAFSVVEPTTGRYWLFLGAEIYVFSFFPAGRITAWSKYLPGFTAAAAVVQNNQVLVRAGNTIYRYGGTDNATYGSDYTLDVVLPMLDATRPATEKMLLSLDLACEGTWTVDLGTRADAPDVRERVCTVTGPTFGYQRIPAVGYGTHFGLRLQHVPGSSPGRLSSAVLHYSMGEDE